MYISARTKQPPCNDVCEPRNVKSNTCRGFFFIFPFSLLRHLSLLGFVKSRTSLCIVLLYGRQCLTVITRAPQMSRFLCSRLTRAFFNGRCHCARRTASYRTSHCDSYRRRLWVFSTFVFTTRPKEKFPPNHCHDLSNIKLPTPRSLRRIKTILKTKSSILL